RISIAPVVVDFAGWHRTRVGLRGCVSRPPRRPGCEEYLQQRKPEHRIQVPLDLVWEGIAQLRERGLWQGENDMARAEVNRVARTRSTDGKPGEALFVAGYRNDGRLAYYVHELLV